MTSPVATTETILERTRNDLRLAEMERDKLAARVAALEARLAQQEALDKAKADSAKRAGVLTGRLALGFAMGFSVRKAFERLFQAMKGGESFPVPELADLGAAIVRRLAFTQLLAALIAVLPLMLLIQQNWLLAGANRRQDTQARVARATQLIELMYETEAGCSAPFGSDRCAPEASPRLRSEAARAYVEIERSEGSRVDLSHARLEQTDLSGADLRGVGMKDANLDEADLSGADLREADLAYATVTDAVLDGADLRELSLSKADLSRSSLVGARLDKAVLTGANLEQAVLKGADLRKAEGLEAARLGKATYDGDTRFPGGFDPAKHGMVKAGG